MKKFLIIFFFGACLTGVLAQVIPTRYWEVAGNAGTTPRNFLGTTDCSPLIIKTNNIERMRLLSDKSFLGIGTDDPQAPLHIHYQVDSVECGMITQIPTPSPNRFFSFTTSKMTNGFSIAHYSLNKNITLKQHENANLSIEGYMGGLTIAPDGNIGVGVSPPTAKLEVGGSFRAQSANIFGNNLRNGLNMSFSNTDFFLKQQEQGNFFIEGPAGGLMIEPNDGYIGMGTEQPKKKLHLFDEDLLLSKSVSKRGTGSGAIYFEMTPNVFGPDWIIEYSNASENYGIRFGRPWNPYRQDVLFLSNNGNIGIGTAIPHQKLHIVDGNILISKTSAKDMDAPQSPNGSILFGANIDDNYNMGKWGIEYLNGEDDCYGLNFWRPWNSGGGGTGNYYLFLADNNNVGINTKNPQTRLDVNGSFRATSANITGNSFVNGKFGVGTATPHEQMQIGDIWTFHNGENKYIGYNATYTSSGNVRIEQGFSSFLNFNANGSILLETAGTDAAGSPIVTTNKNLILTANGDVGIGTKNPNAKLDVSGQIMATSANINGNTYINGNLGIGISNPYTKLQIGDIWTFYNGSLSKIIGRNTYWNGSNHVRIQAGEASHIDFSGTGDIVMRTAVTGNAGSTISSWNTFAMLNNGNVGIGVSNPTVKLDVKGTIRAEEVKVCLSQGCDYVFEEDYELMNLNDLHTFIKTNKHLPDVAPAAEMEAEGINLSEMNATLLKKVEELTLYIILIEKRLSELESEKGGE